VISGNTATTDFEAGGGVWNLGDLTIVGATISDNSATGTSGGGGGISSRGALSISQSTISGNSAGDDGGGVLRNGSKITSGT
jgi:hypothetical protein